MTEPAISSKPIDLAAESLKVAPHSIEAEQSVLGGLMLDNETWDKISDLVIEGDFYRRDHRLIFRSIEALADKGSPFDVVTLSEWLESNDLLENAGGLAYLGTLANNTPSVSNIMAYAQIVRERSVLRQLISVGHKISTSCYETEGRDSAELLDNTVLDFVELEPGKHQFIFMNPNDPGYTPPQEN